MIIAKAKTSRRGLTKTITVTLSDRFYILCNYAGLSCTVVYDLYAIVYELRL